jgi:hypothetical protein
MLDDQAPRGPGLPGTAHPTRGRLITSVRRRAGTERTPGSVLIAVAAWLLALIGGGALFVSFSAQYTYLLTVPPGCGQRDRGAAAGSARPQLPRGPGPSLQASRRGTSSGIAWR